MSRKWKGRQCYQLTSQYAHYSFDFFAVWLTKLETFSRLTSSWILSDFLRRKSESQKMLKVSIFVLGFCNELWQNSCNYAKFVKGDVQHPSLQKIILLTKVFGLVCSIYCSLNSFPEALPSCIHLEKIKSLKINEWNAKSRYVTDDGSLQHW